MVPQTGMAAINRAEGQERVVEAEEVRPDGRIMRVNGSSRKLSWIDKLILRDLL